tara:strand:+ start:61311 stop:61820 length:510 start_codon:yes stop_codon:yes gene_type:complete
MSVDKEFIIPFEGLKVGKHPYSYKITDSFFEDLEYSLIKQGEISVEMVLEKKETMMTADIQMDGFVWSTCDRCTEPMKADIQFEHSLVFKFGEEISEDENLVMVSPNEFKLNMAPHFYELITVELPNKIIHDEGDCNEEMLDLLDKYSGPDNDEDDDIDPRWKALKNLN